MNSRVPYPEPAPSEVEGPVLPGRTVTTGRIPSFSHFLAVHSDSISTIPSCPYKTRLRSLQKANRVGGSSAIKILRSLSPRFTRLRAAQNDSLGGRVSLKAEAVPFRSTQLVCHPEPREGAARPSASEGSRACLSGP